MIEVRNLVKKYGDHLAVDDLSFTVREGEIYGFLGPNGAGKSTTMNIITGCLAATSGEVSIDGHDIFKQPREAKKLIGYLPEQPPLYPDMTPREYLLFVAEMKGVGKKERAQQVDEVMEKTGVTDVQNRLIKNLSKGYKQRVGLAQAILGDPKVVILDEPTVGLDPAQIIEIRGVIRSLAQTHTVIFSSHILSEVSEICSQILIISGGKLVAEDTPENLESRFVSKPVLSVSVKGDPQAIRTALASVPGVEDASVTDNEDGTSDAVVTCGKGIDVKEALALSMLQNGCLILRLEESKASLEDVFMELISQQPELPAQPEQDAQALPELSADDLLDGNMQSAYDAFEAFDAPAHDEDADAPINEPDEPVDAPIDEPEEPIDASVEEPDEPAEEPAQEGGEEDAGDA